MIRLCPALIVIACFGPACAADLPQPPCAQPQVLLLVREHVQRAGLPTVIEPGSIGERPGSTPTVVRCALRLHTPQFDTVRNGPAPRDEVVTFQYTLELRSNAIFLSPG